MLCSLLIKVQLDNLALLFYSFITDEKMADSSKDDSLNLLRRFLYLGNEAKSYPDSVTYPFDSENIQAIFSSLGNESDAIHEILKMYRDEIYLDQKTIIYALAVFANSNNIAVKNEAMKAALDICSSSTAMFTFTYFYKEICKPSKGWGRSLRHFLIKWYNGKEPKDLAAAMTKVKSYRRWTHKDILCMAHVKAKNNGNAAVLKYAVRGLEAAEKEFSTDPDAEPVLSYLKNVYELSHTSDAETAARLVDIHNLCLEHIPSKLLKSKEVALCLIPRVPIMKLFDLIPQYCKVGLLKLNSPHYKALIERLTSEETLSDTTIDPLESFLAIRRWQIANRILPGKNLIRQNTPAIDESLQNLHLASFKNVISTQKRYLIAVDIRPSMFQSACAGCKNVTPSNISEIVLLSLVKAELSNVTVLVFSPEELVAVDINNKMTISDVEEHISKVTPNTVNLSAPLQWALTKKKVYDLFIVFTDCLAGTDSEGCASAFKEYKDTLKVPNTKYLVATLCDRKVAFPLDDPDILNIAGFNVKLLKVIQDFARGAF